MKYVGLVIIALSLASCAVNSYDTGDGGLSYARADFVNAHCYAPGKIDYALSDNGDSIALTPPASAIWATTRDSLYRALLYYNKSAVDATKPLSIVKVSVVNYDDTVRNDTIHTDPVVFESAWIGKNRKYLNIGFYVKTGQADGVDNVQGVGITLDSIIVRFDGRRDIRLRFLHSQNNVPEYYSSKNYVSVPLHDISIGDSVQLIVNTYDGEITTGLAY